MKKIKKMLLPVVGLATVITPVASLTSCNKKTTSNIFDWVLELNPDGSKVLPYAPTIDPVKPTKDKYTAEEALSLYVNNVSNNKKILAEDIFMAKEDDYIRWMFDPASAANGTYSVEVKNITSGTQPKASFVLSFEGKIQDWWIYGGDKFMDLKFEYEFNNLPISIEYSYSDSNWLVRTWCSDDEWDTYKKDISIKIHEIYGYETEKHEISGYVDGTNSADEAMTIADILGLDHSDGIVFTSHYLSKLNG